MPIRNQEIEKIMISRAIRLNAGLLGVVTGILIGALVFLATNWLVIKGGEPIGPHLALLGQFFIGYRVTFWGSLIGFVYGFASGFVAGFGTGFLYNRILALRTPRAHP